MPITGTFLADFTQFDSAVQGAGAKLRAFEGDASKTGVAMKDMEATSQTLSTRMVALGAAVGSFVGNFAANLVQQGVRSIVSMGVEAFESAGKILDLSNKTGLAAETIQRMQFVADQTGGSIDQFTQAAFQLGARLSGGSGSVQKAVEELGLSFQQLQTLRPDQQFDTVVAALGRMDDATKRNELGVAIFGRSFATIAAAVAEGYEDIAAGANTSTRAQLESLDRLNDAWSGFVQNLQTKVTTHLGRLVIAFQEADLSGAGLIEMHQRLRTAFEAAGGATEDYESQLHALGVGLGTIVVPAQESYVTQLAKAKAEVAGLDVETRKEIEAAKQLGVNMDELTGKFGLSETAIRMVTGEVAKLATESDRAAIAIERMKSSAPIDMLALTPKDVTIGDSFKPTGAYAQILAEETAIREQADALALVEQQMTENMLVVGQYAEANKVAGDVARAATNDTVQGYAAVAQQVAMSGDAIRAYIDLQKYTAAANAIKADNPLYTSRADLEKISKLPFGGSGSGGGVVVHVDARESFYDTPAGVSRLANKVGDALIAQRRSVGGTA